MQGSGNIKKRTDYLKIGSMVPPHSRDAEIAVLGAMMLDKIAILKSIVILRPDDFYNDKHRIIFRAMYDMFARGVNVDIVTLNEELTQSGEIEKVDGTYYLTEINAKTPSAANIEHHAMIVRERSIKRQMIKTAGMVMEKCYQEGTDALEQLERWQGNITDLLSGAQVTTEKTPPVAAKEFGEYCLKLQSGEIEPIDIPLDDLRRLLIGLFPGELIIIAGRPSMGKTALMLSFVRYIAFIQKKKVGVFSLEMTCNQLLTRMLSAEKEIDGSRLRTMALAPGEDAKIAEFLTEYPKSRIYIEDASSINDEQIRASVNRWVLEYGIEIIFVDFLQLVKYSRRAESKAIEVGEMAKSFKRIAKEFNIPVVVLAQLNRKCEDRPGKKPQLSDLKESGGIEEAADAVILVYRPEHYGIKEFKDKHRTPSEGLAELIVPKQRNGPVGSVKAAFIKQFSDFKSLDMQHRMLGEGEETYEEEEVPF